MTEYQKMLGGQLYNAQDGELQAMHRTAMELCHALNQLNPNQKEEARALLRQLLGRTGEHFTIKSTFWCDYGRHITIGENFFCNYNCVMLDCAPITFGDNVMVAPNCGFYTAAHPLDHTLRDEELEYAKPITCLLYTSHQGQVDGEQKEHRKGHAGRDAPHPCIALASVKILHNIHQRAEGSGGGEQGHNPSRGQQGG